MGWFEMGGVNMMARGKAADESGFSLIEAVVAMAILATALLSLAGVFALGLRQLASSTPNLIAREKAREAVESVHTARDTRTLEWADIQNKPLGEFLVDPQPLKKPGKDGLVNTTDDEDEELEEIVAPGADGEIGTEDDLKTTLSTFTRQIEILELKDADGNVNPALRQLRVTIRYQLGTETREYVLTTYISSIS
jgi:hypothetical protein